MGRYVVLDDAAFIDVLDCIKRLPVTNNTKSFYKIWYSPPPIECTSLHNFRIRHHSLLCPSRFHCECTRMIICTSLCEKNSTETLADLRHLRMLKYFEWISFPWNISRIPMENILTLVPLSHVGGCSKDLASNVGGHMRKTRRLSQDLQLNLWALDRKLNGCRFGFRWDSFLSSLRLLPKCLHIIE